MVQIFDIYKKKVQIIRLENRMIGIFTFRSIHSQIENIQSISYVVVCVKKINQEKRMVKRKCNIEKSIGHNCLWFSATTKKFRTVKTKPEMSG